MAQKIKTFKEQMLEKYPGMDKITHCHKCCADLRYGNKIHRIDMLWYCDKCYKKYIKEYNFSTPEAERDYKKFKKAMEKTKMRSIEEIKEENKKADEFTESIIRDRRYRHIKEILPDVELTKENYDKIIVFLGEL